MEDEGEIDGEVRGQTLVPPAIGALVLNPNGKNLVI